MNRKKVLIIGSGFAGLNAAKSLGNTNFDVWVIDKRNHHLFQPLLYQVASAALSPGDIAKPIREILSPFKNITVIMGNVVEINKNDKRVFLGNGSKINFDYLIVATGTKHSYFGKNEWERYAPGLKTLSDALRIREQILVAFEKAERSDSIAKALKYLRFVIIGGGPTGVEMAGAIAEIAHKTMLKNFRRIEPERTKIYLIEGAETILPSYPKRLSEKAQNYLEKLGVEVFTKQRVTDITNKGVQTDTQFIEAYNVIWAAGNEASPLLQSLQCESDRQGRIIVEKDLSIPNFPHIFVIGDAANAKDKNGKLFPGLAPIATQQGHYVSKLILKNPPIDKRPPFKYFDRGSLATIGKSKAVGVVGKLELSGFLAWVAWCFIHIIYLIGFRNRLLVFTQWTLAYFRDSRGVRLIKDSIDKASRKW